MKAFNISFSDIKWGEDDAKNDDALGQYFVEFPEFDEIISGKKRYIIGRKGTGKSAILQKIRLQVETDPMSFYTDVSLRDFPLSDFRALGEKNLQDKSKYVSAWKFLLLTELACMMIHDASIEETRELELLKYFISENFPDGISMTETITKLKQNKNKITFAASLISGEKACVTSTEATSKIHYNQAVKKLEELLSKIHTSSKFFFLIDELDEGYKAKNSDLNLVILSLLRATEEFPRILKRIGIECLPILALRSDIFDCLEDNDLNKIDDFVLRLNWTTDENHPWSLKQIVEKRIEATVKEKYPDFEATCYWDLVAKDNTAPKGLFQYMCILTFSRPRDIIKLLKYCSSQSSISKLTLSEVQRVENDYSNWFYREFRDEVQSFLSCWKGALNCISEVAKGKAEIKVLLSRFSANEEVKAWCNDNKKNPIDVLKTLFDYSVIGCITDTGRWIFKYKDDFFEYMPSYPSYCVHYGFCRKLRIPKSYDRTIVEVLRSYN